MKLNAFFSANPNNKTQVFAATKQEAPYVFGHGGVRLLKATRDPRMIHSVRHATPKCSGAPRQLLLASAERSHSFLPTYGRSLTISPQQTFHLRNEVADTSFLSATEMAGLSLAQSTRSLRQP